MFGLWVGAPLRVSAAAPASLRTIFDGRVTALPVRALLTRSPAVLTDPARQRVARTITDFRQGLFFGWAGAQIWAFAWLWRSGRAAKLRDFLRRRLGSRQRYRAAFGASLGVLAPLAGLPFAFISYRIGFNVGLSEQVIGSWLLDYAAGMLLDAAGAAIAVAIVLELVDRTRLWYLAYTAIVVAVALEAIGAGPSVFGSLTTRIIPLHRTAAAPVEMARTSTRTRTLMADTQGIGRFTRIVLGDVLIAAATPPEITYVIARENAHVEHDDNIKRALVAIALFVLAVAAAVLVSDRIGFRRDDDAVSRLALVAALLGAACLLLFPLLNAYTRGLEYRAEEDARRTAANPAAAVRFLVRRADRDLVPLCYRRSSGWYFADRPALGSSIAALRHSNDPCPR